MFNDNYSRDNLQKILTAICYDEKRIDVFRNNFDPMAMDILRIMLAKPKWSIESFVFLKCFLNFSAHFVKKNIHEKLIADIISSTLNYYDFLFDKLNELFHEEKIDALLSPINWLAFTEQYSNSELFNHRIVFNEAIIIKIKFSYFGLDWRKSTEPLLPAGLTYTAKKAAEYLSKKLNQEIEKHNVVELCMTNEFDAYIKARKGTESYLAYVAQGVTRFSSKVEDIEAAISSGNVDIKYPYTYDGLIKIKKKKEKLGIGSNTMTLEHICQGGSIQIEKITFFQCSFADYILGSSDWVQINENMVGKMISIDDLLFRQEELDNFIAEITHSNNENQSTTRDAPLSESFGLEKQKDKQSINNGGSNISELGRKGARITNARL